MTIRLTRVVVMIGGQTYTLPETLDPETLDEVEREDDDDSGLDGWYTLRYMLPIACGCGYTGEYAHETHGRHRVIVWPDALDPNLRKMADSDGPFGGTVPYERAMGPAVSFYEAIPS